MILPFGKHKGEHVSKAPTSYLRWLAKNIELREPLATAVKRAIKGLPVTDAEQEIDIDAMVDKIVKPFDPKQWDKRPWR